MEETKPANGQELVYVPLVIEELTPRAVRSLRKSESKKLRRSKPKDESREEPSKIQGKTSYVPSGDFEGVMKEESNKKQERREEKREKEEEDLVEVVTYETITGVDAAKLEKGRKEPAQPATRKQSLASMMSALKSVSTKTSVSFPVLAPNGNNQANQIPVLYASGSQEKLRARVSELQKLFSFFIPHEELEEVRVLGSGNYGTVMLAKFRGAFVTIKKLKVSNTINYNMGKREAEMMQRASHHPNVASFVGVSTDPHDISAQCHIISEFYKNGAVDKFLLKNPKLSWTTLVYMMKCCAAGMLHLHRQDIIHMDLSLRNLLVDNDKESVRVIDFGLAKLLNPGEAGQDQGNLPIPVDTTAPEAICGYVTKKADVYSYGTVIWGFCHRATRSPYQDVIKNHGITMRTLATHIKLKSLNPGCPKGVCYPKLLKALMLSCWHKNPEKRPDFTEIHAELEALYLQFESDAEGVEFTEIEPDDGGVSFVASLNTSDSESESEGEEGSTTSYSSDSEEEDNNSDLDPPLEKKA